MVTEAEFIVPFLKLSGNFDLLRKIKNNTDSAKAGKATNSVPATVYMYM